MQKEYPKVHAYIRSLQEDLWNKYKISPATHMRRLHEIGLRAENPDSKDVNEFDMKPDLKTALAAEISRGKAAGYYEKKEKQTGKGIDNLSLEEVDKLLKQMKNTVIIDQTPTDLEDDGSETVQRNDQRKQSDQQVP